MRALPLLLLCAGCPPVCPEPAAADGTWEVFAVVLDGTGADDPDFPSYHSPANGASTWEVAWGAADAGDVALSLDGTPVAASGVWSREACGAFDLVLDGEITGPTGSVHAFEADGVFVVWDDRLEGTWDWSEVWTGRDGTTTGTFTAEGRVEGRRPGTDGP